LNNYDANKEEQPNNNRIYTFGLYVF